MARGLQKAQSQAKNAADGSKNADERAADRKKNEAAATGQICLLCRQTFSNVAKGPMLRDHWTSKHPKETDITLAFPQLKDCGAAGAATSGAAATAPAKKAAAAAAVAAAAAPAVTSAAAAATAKGCCCCCRCCCCYFCRCCRCWQWQPLLLSTAHVCPTVCCYGGIHVL